MTSTVILQAAGGGNMLTTIVPMVLIMVVFYFFMIRPQVKKAKEHKKLVAELKKGDKIITTAGIHGRIADMNDTTFLIEVEGGVKIRFDKSAVSLDATKAVTAPTKA
ncbi:MULTISPECIES: preprotein translocase subunit YajC [unclassified Pedobacter]|uniref:preprotein translocase subunit YajC n=1 Tax=unclassified Pedobacter TaxID=2628915 RepID=UPI000B4BDABA|nr:MULTISPECIES: preprotein translocase subunit YajC [unclassified Pedobacter]MCX2583727.1 preprotein translocase subunit YajC [Pedobacter sp. MR22-3]OWK71059.1 preprotein translocase subunit YajC [Pedobacter sp. AJM]